MLLAFRMNCCAALLERSAGPVWIAGGRCALPAICASCSSDSPARGGGEDRVL